MRGYKEKFGADQDSVEKNYYKNVIGAQAEMAFARMAGETFHGHFNVGKGWPDVGEIWQVRWNGNPNGDMVVRENDLPHFRYALMIGEEPTFTYLGWIEGRDAKNPDWFEDRYGRKAPCFWVPQVNLI